MIELLFFILIFSFVCLIFFGLNKRRRRIHLNKKIQKTFPYRLIPENIKEEKLNILFRKRTPRFLFVTLALIPFLLFIAGSAYSILFSFTLVLIYYFICIFITMWLDSAQTHRNILLLEQLPMAIETMIRKLQIGSSMDAAVQTVAHEAKRPAKKAFVIMSRNLTLHEPLPKIMGKFSKIYPLETYQLLLMIIKMHEKTGSSPIRSLERVSHVAKQHHYLFSKANVALTQSRIALIVMILAPIILFIFIYNMKPDLIMDFIHAGIGKLSLLLLGFIYLTGLLFFNRVLKLTI